MRTSVLLNPEPTARTIARKKRPPRTRRKLTVELVPSETPGDRAALHAALVPFAVSVFRRWEAEGRLIRVGKKLKLNPDYKKT